MDSAPALRVIDTFGVSHFAAGPILPAVVERTLTALETPSRRLWAVDLGDTQWSVLSTPTDTATLHLVWPAGAEDPLLDFAATVDFAAAILAHFLTNPYEAITVVDRDGLLRWVSPVHARFFGLGRGEGLGQPAAEVIENTGLPEVVRSGTPEIGRLQEMNGVARVVSRFPILQDGAIVGAIGQVMFKGPEQVMEFSREISKLRAEVDYYRRALEERRFRADDIHAILGDSAPIRKLKADITRLGPLDVPVLIQGESGSGKELVARALHAQSSRTDRPLIALNAAALPATLVEAELFGYEPGAFTGADRRGRPGKLELADKSTLFLDEIGDMPPDIQAKLLRVLEEGRFERLGGHRSHTADFRLITATNRPLDRIVDGTDAGSHPRFRADLYFRIGGLTLTVPPLRDRREDIPALARTFLARTAKRHNLPVRGIAAGAISLLQAQPWPGNVRELFNAVQKAAIFCDGAELTAADFPDLGRRPRDGMPWERAGRGGAPSRDYTVVPPTDAHRDTHGDARSDTRLDTQLLALEELLIRQALDRSNGNKKAAAEALGISRTYLYKRLAAMAERTGP